MVLEIEGLLSERECQVLGEVARDSGATRALEVGHYHGRSTAVLLRSLSSECSLVTIDHHQGDYWATETSVDDFLKNVGPYVGDRPFVPIVAFAEDALVELDPTPGFDFVFYDGDHHAELVAEFWGLTRGLLARHCTLVFDDADWEDQSLLTLAAADEGFKSIRTLDFVRHEGDKEHPETYTLEVMRR